MKSTRRHQEREEKNTCSNSSYCSESEATSDFSVEGVSKITIPRHCISFQVGVLPRWSTVHWAVDHKPSHLRLGCMTLATILKTQARLAQGEHSLAVLPVIPALPQKHIWRESIIRNSELEQQTEDFPNEYMPQWVQQLYDSRHLLWICCQLAITMFFILSDSEIPHIFKLMQLNLRCDWYKQHLTSMPSSYHPCVLLIILAHHRF